MSDATERQVLQSLNDDSDDYPQDALFRHFEDVSPDDWVECADEAQRLSKLMNAADEEVHPLDDDSIEGCLLSAACSEAARGAFRVVGLALGFSDEPALPEAVEMAANYWQDNPDHQVGRENFSMEIERCIEWMHRLEACTTDEEIESCRMRPRI